MQPTSELGGYRKLLLLCCFFIGCIVAFEAIRVWLADYRVHTDRLALMARGVALEPQDASAWDRLGRVQAMDFENPNPLKAIADFEKAVAHNRLSADYWIDLAGAYESVGNIPRARDSFQHAREVYPASAQVAWFYGNFLLRQNDRGGGFAEIRQALQIDPSLVLLAISRVWHLSHDANLLVNQVLPANEKAYFEAIDFLLEGQDLSQALVVWQRLLALGKPIDLRRSFPLLELLIKSERSEDASRVWREALAAAGLPHNEPANQSLIWNGDFTQDFQNGGLDWRWNSPFGATIDFDVGPPAGGRSVRLDFSGGANVDLADPFQFAPVEPSRRYHFHAMLRTEKIATENGIFFSITDPYHNSVNVFTENLTGSHPWTSVDVDFVDGPQTHFLLIQARRLKSRAFENKLSGTAWLGDVRLTPVADTPNTK